MIKILAALMLVACLGGTAQAAWCVWPAHPRAPHPCRFGGVPVAPGAGWWWGDAWVVGPWHRWGVGPAYRVYPRWHDHDWGRRDWR